jgi:hypothetical protein
MTSDRVCVGIDVSKDRGMWRYAPPLSGGRSPTTSRASPRSSPACKPCTPRGSSWRPLAASPSPSRVPWPPRGAARGGRRPSPGAGPLDPHAACRPGGRRPAPPGRMGPSPSGSVRIALPSSTCAEGSECVTHVSGTPVTLDSGPNTPMGRGDSIARIYDPGQWVTAMLSQAPEVVQAGLRSGPKGGRAGGLARKARLQSSLTG